MNDDKRLFFAAQVRAPWPLELPPGRLIPEDTRHITLAFLGQTSFSALEGHLDKLPLPPFHVGLGGIATDVVFLPENNPHVVALDITLLEHPESFLSYHKRLNDALRAMGHQLDQRPFHPHITLARTPFAKELWKQFWEPIPFFLMAIHLYESVGNLEYRSLWNTTFIPPFKEIDHTADIAFEICAESIHQLHRHAELALFFAFPPLSKFSAPLPSDTLDEIIIELNNMIASADVEWGCPFKAVSFHSKISRPTDQLLRWEMIVDV